MTSGMIDSKPVFLNRLNSAGLDPEPTARLVAAGVDTLAKLAYLAPVSPASGDDTALMTVLEQIMNYTEDQPMPALTKAVLRRVWFEAHATALSEVKNKLERGDDSAPRKLPLPEREERRAKQQSKISGFKIEGVREPSHALIDLMHTIKEDELLKYVHPEQCTHREAELGGVKRESFLQAEAGGRLRQVNREIPIEADVSTTYKLRLALQRRALAMDQLELADFAVMEDYHEYLFDLMSKPVPPGYAAISVPQILCADKMIWNFMITRCRAGVSVRPDGSQPIHDTLQQALRDPVILSSLQPLPRSSAPNGSAQHKDRANKAPQPKRDQPYPSKGKGGGKGYKGGKGSKGSKGGRDFVPQALKGGKATARDGRRICFNYNLGTCQDSKPGGSCNRGYHICCGCESADHSFNNCPKQL